MNPSNQPYISAIVAMSKNRSIGKNNRLLWHLPADLRHFKQLTTGHPILMGRKTYESIGKPLPNRQNIIITRDLGFTAPGCDVTHSLDEAINVAAKNNDQAEIFVIGGAEIYRQSLPHIQRIYLTIVHEQFEGDVFFPALNANEWQEISREDHQADEKNAYAYSFVIIEKI